MRASIWVSLALVSLNAILICSQAQASVSSTGGAYSVELASDPPVIPVGPAKLMIRVTGASGKPVDGLQISTIAQMPGMPMGEREETATPVTGQPGVYNAPAQFAMQGAYEAKISISGMQGAATVKILLKTGQNLGGLSTSPGGGGGGGIPLWPVTLWIVIGGFALFTLYRMRRTGQRLNLSGLKNPRVLTGLVVIVAVYLLAVWAVKRYMHPGHMSVIEAQAMDMTAMKPPVGAVPVAAMAVKREPMESTVRYSGSAVAFVDVDVAPRVAGTINWMSLYPGDRVRKGQVVARLDPRELTSRVGEQSANVSMAEHAMKIAAMESVQARNQETQARAHIQETRDDEANAKADVAAAQQEVDAARQERAGAQSDLEAAKAGVDDAAAMLNAALADQTYWTAQINRSEALVKTGAISQQEYQQDRAQAENAASKVRQARAKEQQAKSAVVAAQARISKADAMIAGARSKVRGMEAKLRSAQSKIAQAQDAARAQAAASAASEHHVAHTEAGLQQAQAQLNTTRVVASYATIQADIDGVVTQRIISPGVLVQPGQAILRVSQEQPIRLQANVAASDVAAIRAGNTVRVTNERDPKHPIRARVTSVFPSADPVARTSIVEALYPNRDRRFKPGDFITMEITIGENRSALVVPSSAVVWQAQATSPVLATSQQPAVWVIQSGTPEKTVYTCTMHPEVKSDTPGKCPT